MKSTPSLDVRELTVVGERVKQLREGRDLTQGELAEGLCTSSMISQIETGKARPSYHMLSELAKRLGVNVDFFFENREVSEDSVLHQLANLHLQTGDPQQAIQLLQSLLNSLPRYEDATPLLFELIECYLQTGRSTDAERVLSFVESDAVDDELQAKLAAIRGVIAFKAKRYLKAITLWKKALSILSAPEGENHYFHANLLFRISEAYAKLGDGTQALEFCELASSSMQQDRTLFDQAKTCLQLAKEFHRKQDYSKAIQYANRAKHLNDLHRYRIEAVRNRLDRGLITLQAQPSEVTELLVKSLRRFERLESPLAGFTALKLARQYLQAEDVSSALAAHEKAESWIPNGHPLRGELEVVRGLLLSKQNRQQGEKLLRKLASDLLSQNHFFKWEEAMSNLAWIYADGENFETACHLLKQSRVTIREQREGKGIQLGSHPSSYNSC